MRKRAWLLWTFLPAAVSGQSSSWTDNVSFKAAYSFSINQYGPSPFSSTRPLRRAASSVLFNLQYAQPMGEHTEASIAVQATERGFVHNYRLLIPGYASMHTEYEHRLQYLELPLNFIYHYKRLGIILGIVPGYLYESDFRFVQRLTRYQPGGGIYNDHTTYVAVKDAKGTFKTWDFGATIGLSATLGKGLDAEFTAQKQLVYANGLFKNNKDIAYLITLSLGLRYRFLSRM